MAGVKKTVVEAIVLGILGLALGFGANTVRGSGAIKPTKNYFATGVSVDSPARNPALPVAPTDGRPTVKSTGQHRKHDYQTMSFDEVTEVFADRDTELGLNLFVDARRAEDYREGHIPGAIHCFPFKIQDCIEEIIERGAAAERIIAYCAGYNCEDSIFLCREMIEAGILYEQVYLYEGGLTQWTTKDQPIEKGP